MTTSAEIRADVLVVGGGLAGLSLTAALGTAGVETVCVDRDSPATRADLAFDGRTTAIALGSRRILEGGGVWAKVPEEAKGAILEIRVADSDSPLFLHYDHREVGDEPFGWIVENRELRLALFARLAELATVRHLAPAMVEGLERTAHGVLARLSDGRTVRASLVVGADGRNSMVRRWAGVRTIGWDYPQTAIVCCIEHEFPHHGVALEHFLPAGPFAVLPMHGNRSSVVWTERRDAADAYLSLPPARFHDELSRRAGEWLGRVEVVGRRFSYPLSLLHAERYAAERVALIGEAAHAIHPIAGQGLNLGLRDVAQLAETVVDRLRLGLDPGDRQTLARFQRLRRLDNVSLAAVTDGLNRLFSNAVPPVALARRLGLAAVGRVPPLKRFLMRHAMGTTGALPRLARGEPI
jgi:2-octaprenyl-6-methoxyphenol hydroxylase